MCEQRGATERGGKNRGVGQWRHLVAEIGTRQDSPCCPTVAEALRLANAHQCHANCGNGRPRTACHYRDDGTDKTAGDEENVWIDNLHAIVDEHWHDAAYHPSTREQPNGLTE